MQSQIIRVASYAAGSINSIGREEYRHKYNHKNTNIDEQRKKLNVSIGNKQGTLHQAWKTRIEQLGLKFAGKKNQVALEQMVVTASPEFFKQLGWDKEQAKGWERENVPKEIIRYFNDSLKFVREYVGKENVLSATIHFDEESPHLHIDYIPSISGKSKRKDVYLKDEFGKCIRGENGHAIRAKDQNGKTLYEYVDEPASINRGQFWSERGGRQSYRMMQDLFHEKVASNYGLDRGQIGSDHKHEDQSKHRARQLKDKIEEGNHIVRKQEEYLYRQRKSIDLNNNKIIQQNETIEHLQVAIDEVQKDREIMEQLERNIGLKNNRNLDHDKLFR